MTNQQEEERLFKKLKSLNQKNRVVALAAINTLFISQLTEVELEDAVKKLISNIKQ